MARVLRQIDDEALERPFDKSQFLRLMKYMKPYTKTVSIALVLMVIAMVCSLGQTFLLSRAVSSLEGDTPIVPYALVISMVVMAILGALCSRYRVRLMDSAGRKALINCFY